MLSIGQEDPEVLARSYVEQRFSDLAFSAGEPGEIAIDSLAVTFNSADARLDITAELSMATTFIGVVGLDTMSYRVTSSGRVGCAEYDADFGGSSYLNAENEYVITPDETYQSGYLWLHDKLDLARDFSLTVKLFAGTKNETGADGFAMVIHNDQDGAAAKGNNGEALGATWHKGADHFDTVFNDEDHIVAPAIMIEFDTWPNPGLNEVYNDHTDLFLVGNSDHIYTLDNTLNFHGSEISMIGGYDLGNIEDGNYHFLRLVWIQQEQRLIYFFDGAKVGELDRDLEAFFDTDQVFVGFTGSTGMFTNLQKACFYRVFLL